MKKKIRIILLVMTFILSTMMSSIINTKAEDYATWHFTNNLVNATFDSNGEIEEGATISKKTTKYTNTPDEGYVFKQKPGVSVKVSGVELGQIEKEGDSYKGSITISGNDDIYFTVSGEAIKDITSDKVSDIDTQYLDDEAQNLVLL